jgi:hypothetical protein
VSLDRVVDKDKRLSAVLDEQDDDIPDALDLVLVDEFGGDSSLLNQLSDWCETLRSQSRLGVRREQAYERMQAGLHRWEWLVRISEGQGLVLVNDHFTVGQERSVYLLFRRTTLNSRWRIRNPLATDYQACSELFERAFGHPISKPLWDWKYGDGRGRAVLALRGNVVIAHYGCVSRRICLRGKPAKALQICDVMVEPTERAVMTRSGAFTQIARTAQEQFIGFETEHELGFGFPNQRHMQLAHRMGLYDEVERLDELEWRPGTTTREAWFTESLILDPTTLNRALLERLWGEMQAGLSDRILVIRDADYWEYRYVDRPQQSYVLLAVRRRLGGNILSIAALRRDENECKLLDVLGHPRHYGLVVNHALRQTAMWGLPVLRAWITQGCAGFFTTPGVSRKPTDIVIPLNAHARSRAVSDIQDRWFLMMGDTDFL